MEPIADAGDFPTDVSADGSALLLEDGFSLYRWEEGVRLELFSGSGVYSSAFGGGLSADGLVAVGWIQTFVYNPPQPAKSYSSAAVWGPPNAQGKYPLRFLRSLDFLNRREYALAVSADGSVVVGSSKNTLGTLRAVRWDADDIVVLGGLGGEESWAYGVSADGSVVVGSAERADGLREPFRWEGGTMVGLGMLPGDWQETVARAVSADGSIIVGYARNDLSQREPFIWDQAHGIRSLSELLAQNGVDLSDWELGGAVDISADGRVIVGNGYHICLGRDEAWIATIPEPSTLTGLASLAAALLLTRLCRKRKR